MPVFAFGLDNYKNQMTAAGIPKEGGNFGMNLIAEFRSYL